MTHKYRYISLAFVSLLAIIVGACSDESILLDNDGENVVVTYYPTLNDTNGSRASIGDASGIDALQVVVFESRNSAMTKVLSLTEDWTTAQRNGIKLSLIEGRSYNILFWAHCSSNTAYTVTDDGKIAIDYTDYLDGGFSMMEDMDAFYFVDSMTIGNNVSKPIGMKRPFAQVNFADKTTNPVTGTHKAVVTYHNIPSAFNPFSGEVAMADKNDTADDVQFTFTDFPAEQLTTDTGTYNYVASNYLFAPTQGVASLWATLQLQLVDGTPVNTFEFKADDNYITLQQNMKTNVVGNIVEQPQAWSVWDGSSRTMPNYDTVQNRYVIDEASDIAWLGDSASTLNANSTLVVTKDIDMAAKSNLSAISWPEGTTFNGDSHTIKGLRLDNAFFGDASKLKVKNLTIDDAIIANTGHVGVLVNTLKGDSEFSNVTISNSSATTTNGAAGGFVGYISKTSEQSRTETMAVSFSGCKLNSVTVSGSASEGKFVGLLCGYDDKESLTFDDKCDADASTTVTDYSSVYIKANNSVWVEGTLDAKYDGWLGHETYRRAKITFAGVRMAPRWDGTTKITPLADGTTKLIYSAFDLASLQGSGHTAVTFKENVDLGGDRTTNKNPFTPISTIGTLNGSDKTIYNLYVNVTNWIGGFISSSSGTTSHKNINFYNSSITVTPTSGSEFAYAGTLCAYIEGAYTTSNVHVENSYVKGVSKIGGLIGFITGSCTNATIDNCSVEKSNIENIYLKLDSETFPASGEIGGLIGFITASSSSSIVEVKNSWVTSNNFNCCTYKAAMWDRSVNPFIGDIATMKGETIKISNCAIKGTNVYTNCETGNSDTFDTYSGYLSKKNWTGGYSNTGSKLTSNLMGQCYCVYIPFIFTSWTMGKVYVDEVQIFGLK